MMKSCNPFFGNTFLCFYLFELHKGIGDFLDCFQKGVLEFKLRLLPFYFRLFKLRFDWVVRTEKARSRFMSNFEFGMVFGTFGENSFLHFLQ